MPLVYWYKDSETKECYYYDTDDLNNKQYTEVCRLEKEMTMENNHFKKNYFELKEQRDRIIRLALMGSEEI